MELVGFLLPAVIDLVNRRVKSGDLRFWISVLFCVVVGVIINLMQNNFMYPGASAYDIFLALSEASMEMFGIAQLSYMAVYKDSKLQTSIRGTKK